MLSDYTIDIHRHRFAAWAAGRAASVITCRITVEKSRTLIEAAGLNVLLENPDRLPSPDKIDESHKGWRETICEVGHNNKLQVSHGVAAKLINIYFKSAFVCGGHHDHTRVHALHPPIDSLLLSDMKRKKFGGRTDWDQTPWSKLNSEQYQTLIEDIRRAVEGRPLWTLEEHWIGYR